VLISLCVAVKFMADAKSTVHTVGDESELRVNSVPVSTLFISSRYGKRTETALHVE
jgi:hypothetical protein